jgi:hypothetical protein
MIRLIPILHGAGEITNEPEIIDSISELHDCLMENLQIAGVAKEAVLSSGFIFNISLL